MTKLKNKLQYEGVRFHLKSLLKKGYRIIEFDDTIVVYDEKGNVYTTISLEIWYLVIATNRFKRIESEIGSEWIERK